MAGTEKIEKLKLLLSLAFWKPTEFVDRLRAIVEVNLDKLRPTPRGDDSISYLDAIQILSGFFPAFASFMCESRLEMVEKKIALTLKSLDQHGPFGFNHNADFVLGRLCYGLCRITRPSLVVETGAAYGVTSAYMLAALNANDHGQLKSIDLPPLGKNADQYVGIMIPDEFRSRWELIRGASRRKLGPLLKGKIVDLFVHDSLHTHPNMTLEFEAVLPFLGKPGIIVADDIEGNLAFNNFCLRRKPYWSTVVREADKAGMLGLAIMNRP